VQLKETGQCEFDVPELYLDLFYPGQYRRRIKAVRLTIPCITGPYTNVSARLTLLSSQIRSEPRLGPGALAEVPPTRTASVAMSTAQSDAGVFDLTFRDERYLPFEGAGAVSRWSLELPATVRPFDYQSITDVILNLGYTAQESTDLRDKVESRTANLAGSLLTRLRGNDLVRVFSLRQEFSAAFNRLVRGPAGTPVTFDITERHFPLFLSGRALNVTGSELVVGVSDRGADLAGTEFDVDGTTVSGFGDPADPPDPEKAYGGLPATSFAGDFRTALAGTHTITLTDPGDLDPGAIQDLLVAVTYRLA
jgi:hypothetical protein